MCASVPGRPGMAVAPSPGPPPTPVGPAAPLFVKELKHQALKVGGQAVFECRVTGNPSPQLSWSKNGTPIQSGYRYTQPICDQYAHHVVMDTFLNANNSRKTNI